MTNESQQSNKKGSRRWWQFSIRSLLIGSVITAIIVGGFFNRMRTKQLAVNTIVELGGRVTYEDTLLGSMLPSSLRESVSIHATAKVVSAELFDRRMTKPNKQELASFVGAVKRLPHVKRLSTHRLNLKDDDLAIFAPLRNQVEELTINEYPHANDFRGARLELLDGWNQLRKLSIYCSSITVVAIGEPAETQRKKQPGQLNLKPLSKLPRLEELAIGSGTLSDQVFEDLTQIRRLKRISLSSCRFSGKGFAMLAKLRHLEHIWLHNTHPEANFGAYSLHEDGSKNYLDEPTFYFEQSHDDSMGSEKGFPQKKYQQWIKATFGDVEIFEMYIS